MSKREKRLEKEVVDCLQEIANLPDEWMAQQHTAGQMFGGLVTVCFDHVRSPWDETMRRVSPLQAADEDVSCWRESKKAYKKFTVYKIGERLFRVHSDTGYHPQSRWHVERLSKGNWCYCDTYQDDYWREAEKSLAKAWNKRRREALRAIKGQTKADSQKEKKADKVAQITNQKMATALKATELRDELNEFLKALEDGTVTQAQCAALYSECQKMGQAQKELRRVMGTRMPKE